MIHQLFPNKLIKFKLFNFDKTDLVFLILSGIVLEKLSFQKVSTINFLARKWKKWAKNYLICTFYQIWEMA